MLGNLLQPEIEELIEAGQFSDLREVFRDMSPADCAELIEDLDVKDTAVIFRILPRDQAAEVFECLPIEDQVELVKALAKNDVARLLNDMAPDDRTALLEELPANVTRQLLSFLSPDELTVAKTLLGYPEESIGRRMTPDYIAVREDWTVEQVLGFIREHGKDKETLNVVYIVDPKGLLIDDLRLREILLSPLTRKVSDLMDRRFFSLVATDDQETAVEAFSKYDRIALPVTDTQGVLIGIVTVDDVLDVQEEEATEDIQKLGGMEALGMPYLSARFQTMVRKRAGWLVVLFFGEMLTASAMGFFEHEISKAVVLALFVPLIISSGGNSGSQATSLVIRAIALGEVTLSDWWRVMRREALAGLTFGAILGAFGFLRIALGAAFTDAYGPHWLPLAFTLWVTLIGVVGWGTLAGALLPLIIKRLGADPAAASAPFVATLVDVTGLIIYFGAAALLLKGTLL